MRKIVELNFGMGNIRSLQKAFEYLGEDVVVSGDYRDIADAYALLLPGDGAFGKAMSELKRLGMVDAVMEFHAKERPILGVCIGFQILFDTSTEFGDHKGFGFVPGAVERFPDSVVTPHMGWNNTVRSGGKSRLMENIPDGASFYYVHSYRFAGENAFTRAVAEYAGNFTSILEHPEKNLYATQFHPEKSHKDGLAVLRNFLDTI